MFSVTVVNAVAQKLYDLGITPALRIFHRDGCTGIVVDQFGNEPDI